MQGARKAICQSEEVLDFCVVVCFPLIINQRLPEGSTDAVI